MSWVWNPFGAFELAGTHLLELPHLSWLFPFSSPILFPRNVPNGIDYVLSIYAISPKPLLPFRPTSGSSSFATTPPLFHFLHRKKVSVDVSNKSKQQSSAIFIRS